MISSGFARSFFALLLAACALSSVSGQLAAESAPAGKGNAPVIADTVFRNGDIHTI